MPQDSGFFCYRAVECLVHYFMFEYASEPQKKSGAWVLLRDKLGVTEDVLREIKSAADPQRHGNVTETPDIPRQVVMTNAWSVVEKFVVYALGCSAQC